MALLPLGGERPDIQRLIEQDAVGEIAPFHIAKARLQIADGAAFLDG